LVQQQFLASHHYRHATIKSAIKMFGMRLPRNVQGSLVRRCLAMPSRPHATAVPFILIMANGVFAMAEIAIVAARKNTLRQLAAAGDTRAQAALDLPEFA